MEGRALGSGGGEKSAPFDPDVLPFTFAWFGAGLLVFLLRQRLARSAYRANVVWGPRRFARTVALTQLGAVAGVTLMALSPVVTIILLYARG